MFKKVVASLVLGAATFHVLSVDDSGYNEFTVNALKHFGNEYIPTVVIRINETRKDAESAEKVAKALGAHSNFGVDIDLFVKDLERRSGFSYDKRKLDPGKVGRYVQTMATFAEYRKSPVCVIRASDDLYQGVIKAPSIDHMLTIAHEAAHCPQLSSFLKRESYQEALPGVFYLKGSEIKDQYDKGLLSRSDAVLMMKYQEYIREVSADIASLLYFKLIYSNDEMSKFIEAMKAKRSLENYKKYPDAVGHYTLPFIEMIESDLSVLDRYQDEFKSDTFLASMKLAYDLGKDHSFTFESFKKRYGHLKLSALFLK